jgi:predicted molibdopterin-dependent oxidoreductase YjgC
MDHLKEQWDKGGLKWLARSVGAKIGLKEDRPLADRYRAKTLKADTVIQTVCTYCGVGCNLEVKVKDEKVAAISGIESAAVNQGHSCLKGRYAFGYVHHPERLTSPLIRRDGELV